MKGDLNIITYIYNTKKQLITSNMGKTTFTLKKMLIFLFLFLGVLNTTSQNSNGAIDVAGDIAFVAYHDNDDGFAFILLDDCLANTIISFIDDEADNTGNFPGIGEGELVWQNNTGTTISKGTVITVTDADDNTAGIAATMGSIYENDTEDTPNYSGFSTTSTASDQLYAILGRRADTNPLFLAFAGSVSSIAHGLSGTGLINGVNAILLTNEGHYSGSTVCNSTIGDCAAMINNPSNWVLAEHNFPSSVSGNFSGSAIVACTDPDVPTVNYTPTTICNGNTATLNIAGSLNDATEWKVYTGSCGGTEVASTSTSSVNVTPSSPSTTYYIRGEGGCVTPGSCASVTVNVTNLDDASFNYSASSYCQDASDPSPTITGLTGGTFSSTPGLSISSSGVIDVSASTPNTYTVTYTTSGTCPNSSTTSVTINALDNANFSYGASSYCKDASDPFPTITGLTGGTFSSTAGLSIASNGVIDVSASTPNTYTVTYTTAGTCPNSSSVSVTINDIDDASFNYASSSYTIDDADPSPTITGLTGGSFSSTAGLSIASSGTIDLSASTPNTYTVTYTTAGTCPSSSTFDVTITYNNYTWTGNINNSWEQPGNWNTNVAPHTTGNVIIPSGLTNYPTISSATTVNSINIASGASLIANATVTGTTTYARNLPTTNWYLVSAPVSGETQQDVIANHTFATGAGSNIGIGGFTNNGVTPWNYATNSSMGPLVSGAGVSMKLAAAGDVSITGALNTSNVSFPINTGTRNNFNLIGNPFTSYVNSSTFAAANTGLLSEETVWLWDGTQYVTYNNVTPIELAPSQGFFVEANGSGNIMFSSANQSHQSSDTFMRQTPTPTFELFMESDSNRKSTKVFYVADKTTGWDNGYDSKMFGGVIQNFAVYTELVTNNEGKKLAIQTLPNTNFETMVIPVGIIAEAGKEITFSINSLNLPSGIEIYLEDRNTNTFVNLSSENYTITLSENTNSSGQFFLHTINQSLSNADAILNSISLYKSSNKTITVNGLYSNEATLNIYSVIGQQMLTKEFTSKGNTTINLPHLASGIYLAKLNTPKGEVSKKIIIN